ncbi:MAG TPA: efflux transporter outer membrane subunit [Novosphingobium sp.]|nr:efflux transporter outer membrane subunit [Novosphingobium sp.]
MGSVATLAMALAGCAVGPNFHTPPAPKETAYTPKPAAPAEAPSTALAGGTQDFAANGAVDARWWRQFGSARLDALVDQALAANTDLAAAQSALKSARESWLASKGALFPAVTASAGTSRNRDSQYLSPTPNNGSTLYNLNTAQVSVGYTLDLFGGNRRGVEASRAQYEAQRFAFEATRISIINTLAAAVFQEASLARQVSAQERIVAINAEQLAILRHQQEVGQASGADVAAQEGALAQARATLAPLAKSLNQSRDAIAYLTGAAPDKAAPGIDLASLALPAHVPVALPSALVRQRPDVRMAEAQLHAASALVGVAVANRLPTLTLSAAAGGSSGGWSDLLSAANHFWTIGAGVAQPIFAGGTLYHKQRGAEADYKQADALYRSAVLGAFQNVADTLYALDADARALDAAAAGRAAAERAYGIAQRQFSQGQIGWGGQLSAELTLRQAEQSEAQAAAQRLTDTAALYQALGGGWSESAKR